MERKEAQRIVTEMGGKIVTGEYGKIKNANLLVCGTIIGGAQTTQKMDQASQRKVATITAEQFFDIIAGK